jgi:hypothetical protein
VSEPEHPREWRDQSDQDADCIALLTLALAGDTDTAADFFESLTRGQLIGMAWQVSKWWKWALEHGHGRDPFRTLQQLGVAIAAGTQEGES